MRVYRCVTLQEVINKYKNLEDRKKENSFVNTHKYEKDKSYIHFFAYYDFAKYYFELGKDGKYDEENAQYILFMVANIPNDILEKYKGFGFYKLNGENVPMLEYAIPKEVFHSDYIVDMTEKPRKFGVTRKNEKEEYGRYLAVIHKLKQSCEDVKVIANYLLKKDLSKLLGMKIDTRNELEIQKEEEELLAEMIFPKSDDLEIEEFEERE